MADTIAPTTTKEVEDAVRWAISAGEPLEVVGGGTKRAIGEPSQTAYALDLSGLAGIIAYEPEELVLTLRPGTGMAELAQALREKNQTFAFEPPDLAPLLGSHGAATFGGTYATNFAGPRRLSAGAVRDHMLGIEAVSGRGEAFRAGGRVVKNVTGYDLARALCGSWGTLAAATELAVKVMPRPETEASVLAHDLDAAAAVALMARAMGSAADVSGAAHVPAEVAAGVPGADGTTTALRLEGFGPSVAARRSTLEPMVAGRGGVLEGEASQAFWRAVRDASPFVGGTGALWRCSVAPSAGPAIAAAAPESSRALFDWAGGLVWIEVGEAQDGEAQDGGAAAIRNAIANAGGGHALLVRAPLAMRSSVPTFQPASAGLRALSNRLRDAFDPNDVLNPGRMSR